MKKWLIECSTAAIDIDYSTVIESETEPTWCDCENIAREHGCEWWMCEEIKEGVEP